MPKAYEFFPFFIRDNATPIMIFIDGENFTIRYKNILQNNTPEEHVIYEPNIFVWSENLNLIRVCANVLRCYYYTSVTCDYTYLNNIIDRLKSIGIEAPRVFKKSKSRGSKRVDISLATDMLSHAHRKNYEIAVLIAGDEDYVPLVEAVQAEGCRVFLWFFPEGLSKTLKQVVDKYDDITPILFAPNSKGIVD